MSSCLEEASLKPEKCKLITKKREMIAIISLFFRRGEKTRTFDPLHPMQVR